MPANRNLWFAIFAGTGLTGLLMLALYSQVKPLEQAEQPATEPAVAAKPPIQTQLPAPTNPLISPEGAVQKPSDSVPAKTPEQIIDLPGLPEDPTLSQQEIEQLSAQERAKYEALLKTYQEVRTQVLNLHREREKLRQRMDMIIEENTEIDQQLEQLREEHNKTRH